VISDLAALWRESDWVPRFALLVAAAAALTHVASLLGAGWSQLSVLGVALHLSVMGVIIGFFVGLVRDRVGGWGRALSVRPRVPLPRRLVWLCVRLAVYTLLWFVGVFAYYGEGGTDIRNGQQVWVRQGEVVREFSPAQAQWFDAHTLSVFSAAWLAAALPLALAHHRRRARVIDPDLAA
jgi:hypothetical protein